MQFNIVLGDGLEKHKENHAHHNLDTDHPWLSKANATSTLSNTSMVAMFELRKGI